MRGLGRDGKRAAELVHLPSCLHLSDEVDGQIVPQAQDLVEPNYAGRVMPQPTLRA